MRRLSTEAVSPTTEVRTEVASISPRNPSNTSRLCRLWYSGTSTAASTIGQSRNSVSTVETRQAASNLPERICRGVNNVVSSRSNVWRSRSLVTAPAEKTGPTSRLNSNT